MSTWQAMTGEVLTPQHNVSKKISLVIGARHHLEFGHEKYVMDTIQSHPAQVTAMFFFTLLLQ